MKQLLLRNQGNGAVAQAAAIAAARGVSPSLNGNLKPFTIIIAESGSEDRAYMLFDLMGLNALEMATVNDPEDLGTFQGTGANTAAEVIEKLGHQPFYIKQMRITLPTGVTTFPGVVSLVQTGIDRQQRAVILDQNANRDPSYNDGNTIDFSDVNFGVFENRGIKITVPQGTARNHTFTFFVSAVASAREFQSF